MMDAIVEIPQPRNEAVLSYAPGSHERQQIRAALTDLVAAPPQLQSVIAGRATPGEQRRTMFAPHSLRTVIGTLHQGGAAQVAAAVAAARAAKPGWMALGFEERAAIFLRAAELFAGRYRARINAATMLGQSKTVYQAEIDAACELVDFLRFNVYFARRLLSEQPLWAPGMRNVVDYRPLEGFVLAVTPFNFTAIAANLPCAPALLGNTVVWKPATAAALSNQAVLDVLVEAGLPPGVINLVHASGRAVSEVALREADLAGVHFTGSTAVFQQMWQTVGQNIAHYRTYPRLVGETGGKDFIVAHPSADVEALCTAIVRGSFEYQGQKCSAASRLYVPHGLWKILAPRLEAEISQIKVGDVAQWENLMGAVIDEASFENIKQYIDYAKQSGTAKVWLGGGCDKREGYFVEPTVVLVEDGQHRLLREEIFGPVLTVYCYRDAQYSEALSLCDGTSAYGLTGAIFARDRQAIVAARNTLRFAAGNFYINDKPTGAVVGQQPFGGARASGTNDKAGSMLNLLRWTSPRAIKETFDGPRQVSYPSMLPE